MLTYKHRRTDQESSNKHISCSHAYFVLSSNLRSLSIIMAQTAELEKLNEFSEKRQTLVSYRNYRNKRTERKVVGERIDEVFDKGSFVEIEPSMETKNPLDFDGYKEKIRENQNVTGAKDSVKCGAGTIDGITAVGAELSKNFLMGSMGTVEGEKLLQPARDLRIMADFIFLS